VPIELRVDNGVFTPKSSILETPVRPLRHASFELKILAVLSKRRLNHILVLLAVYGAGGVDNNLRF